MVIGGAQRGEGKSTERSEREWSEATVAEPQSYFSVQSDCTYLGFLSGEGWAHGVRAREVESEWLENLPTSAATPMDTLAYLPQNQ